MRKLFRILASKCDLKSMKILSGKREINKFSIWRLRRIRTHYGLIVNKKLIEKNFVSKLI